MPHHLLLTLPRNPLPVQGPHAPRLMAFHPWLREELAPECVTARDCGACPFRRKGPACPLLISHAAQAFGYPLYNPGLRGGGTLSHPLAQLLGVLKGLHPRRLGTQTRSFIPRRKRRQDSRGMQRRETMAQTPASEVPSNC